MADLTAEAAVSSLIVWLVFMAMVYKLVSQGLENLLMDEEVSWSLGAW